MSNRNIDRIREGLSTIAGYWPDADVWRQESTIIRACLDELESDFTETKRALRKLKEREEKP